jgi:hypothetical protein
VDTLAFQPTDGQQSPADYHDESGSAAEPDCTEMIHFFGNSDRLIKWLRDDDTGNMAEEYEYDAHMKGNASPSEHFIILQKLARLGGPSELVFIIAVDVTQYEYCKGNIRQCYP